MGSRIAGAGRVIPHRTETPEAQTIRNLFTNAVTESFIADNRERSRRPGLSLSGLGGCSKAAAYAISKTPPSDEPGEEEARAAVLGGWEHAGLLPRMAEEFGGEHEVPLKLRVAGIVVPGTADLIAPLPKGIAAEPGAVALADAKTVGEHRLHGVRRAGAYEDHRVQVWGYALAAHQKGLTVEWVVWVYMDRATGEVETVVERFDVRTALAVVNHGRRLRMLADAPDHAPREGYGPGLSFACDRCWWLRRCWGEGAVAEREGAQRNLLHNDADIELAALMYHDAKRREKEAKSEADFAKATLTGVTGRYGAWNVRYQGGANRLDQPRAKELLSEAGLEVPYKRAAGFVKVAPAAKVDALPPMLDPAGPLRVESMLGNALRPEARPALPAGEDGPLALSSGEPG